MSAWIFRNVVQSTQCWLDASPRITVDGFLSLCSIKGKGRPLVEITGFVNVLFKKIYFFYSLHLCSSESVSVVRVCLQVCWSMWPCWWERWCGGVCVTRWEGGSVWSTSWASTCCSPSCPVSPRDTASSSSSGSAQASGETHVYSCSHLLALNELSCGCIWCSKIRPLPCKWWYCITQKTWS